MDIVILTSIRLFGDSLASFFSSRDVSVVTIAHSFSMLHEVFSASHVDLTLIDVTQGIDLDEVRTVAGQWPSIALLAIGLKVEQKEVVRCGRAGFSGYVPRDASLDQLFQAMEDAVVGRLSCPPEIAGELLRSLYRGTLAVNADEHGEALTSRECDVLRELGNGLSNKEIARKLGLSISTIKHHVHKILDKLQVVRRAEAMRKVRDTPWIAVRQRWEGIGRDTKNAIGRQFTTAESERAI